MTSLGEVSLVFILLIFSCEIERTEPTLAPYGDIMGIASTNVPAYSNGNDNYISNKYYFLHGVYMGMKWQCVEFSRRWLFLRKGCVFRSVYSAADMWRKIKFVQRVVDGKCFYFEHHRNGALQPPINESLVIYSVGPDMPFGHVAVIVDVGVDYIRVGEENYDADYWKKNYSRQIPFEKVGNRYYIRDQYRVDGWMSIKNGSDLSPLTHSDINMIVQQNLTSPSFLC